MNISPPFPNQQNIASTIAKMAVRALYFELKAYPKPGLVSFIDSGAHHDMNGETLFKSIFSLRHYFYMIASEKLRHRSFEQLKQLALQAEQRMLNKTSGINTHRGAIFALGLCSISSARLAEAGLKFTPERLRQQLLTDWQLALLHHQSPLDSHGALVRKTNQIVDAKQMAFQGYAIIFKLLPSFISIYNKTKSLDTACLFAYLELLLKIDDTNILYRKGKIGLDYAKERATKTLAISCYISRHKEALLMHQEFSEQGISPGGVADLIGVLLFLSQLFCEQIRCHS